MTKAERETIIHVHDGVGTLSVYSCRRSIWAKCERAGLTLTLKDGGGREYVGKAESLIWRVRKLGPRVLSPAQAEALKLARQRRGKLA